MSILHRVIEISIALFVAGIVLPLGINSILNADNAGSWGVVGTVVTVLVPVLACIGIALLFIPELRGKRY